MQRAYGYVYDPLNRLLQGDYVARAPNAPTPPPAGAWTLEQDRYRLSFVSYDDNGNILTLRRRGLLTGGTHATAPQFGPVDELTYAYVGNRLQAVDDAVSGNQLPRPLGYNGAPASLAGDFQEGGTHLNQEYLYDANGNLTQDRNKGITGIAYNHLNLPRLIHFGVGADSLVFRYTASGQKVAKLVYQTGKAVQRTDYLGPFQYEGDSLRFFPHAEGRVLRVVSTDGANQPTVRYEREFSFKDHLGNLRLAYRLGQVRTLRTSLNLDDAAGHGREAQQFDSLSVSAPVAQRVGSGLARTDAFAARLNAGGSAPHPLGPLAQLAVQQGDTVSVTAYGLYTQPVQHNFLFTLGAFLTGLLHPAQGAPAGPDPSRGRSGLPLLQVGVAAGLSTLPQLGGGVPKGYLRVLVFNRDSALVGQYSQQLSASALNSYQLLSQRVVVPEDGYVSAYVGNESDVDVLFDDISVEHRPGVQVQEVEYDPAGLELAGLGTSTPGLKALSQYKFNGKEFQADLGLNWNHQDWRFFDTQLLRWHVVDPEIENGQEAWTPYSFGYDNAVRYADANGRYPGEGGANAQRAQQYFSGVASGLADTAKATGNYFATHLNPVANAMESAKQTQEFLANPVGAVKGAIAEAKAQFKSVTSNDPNTAGRAMGGVVFQAVAAVVVDKVMKGMSPCGCFTAGTGVSTRLGRRPIEDLQVGDSVWAYNEGTRQTVLRPVTQLLRFVRDTVYVLHTAGGEAIRTTSDHPFYVGGQWVRVKRLRVGDSLVSQGGQRHVLRRIELKPEHVTVYNFTVDELHTYFVGSSAILVHNSGPCPGAGGGKASNKLEPYKDPKTGAKADGSHSSFSRDNNGNIYKYETYERTISGHDNPTLRFDGGKPDGMPGAPHNGVPTPHMNGKSIPGGVRAVSPAELPKNPRF